MIIKYFFYAALAFLAIISSLNVFFAIVNMSSPHTRSSSQIPVIIGCTLLFAICGLIFFLIKDMTPESLNSKFSDIILFLKNEKWWFAGALMATLLGAALMGLPWAAPIALLDMIFGFLHSKVGFPLIKAKDNTALLTAVTLSLLGPWIVLFMTYTLRHFQVLQSKGKAAAISTLILMIVSYFIALIG